MRLDCVHHVDNELWIKGLVQSGATQKVPGVNHEVDETEPQIRSGENVALRARHDPVEGRCGECSCLTSCRLDHGSNRIIPQLITAHYGPSLVAINAFQQERGEPVSHDDVLNQLAHRDIGRRRPLPRVRRKLTHDPFELGRSCFDQLHVAQASALARRYLGRRPKRIRDRALTRTLRNAHTESVAPNIPDPTDGWADGRSPYLWDKQLDGVLRVVRGITRPDLRRRPVRHVMIGLVFVVVVFVVVPVAAILVATN